MSDELFEPAGKTENSHSRATAAGAAVLQLAGGAALLKTTGEHDSRADFAPDARANDQPRLAAILEAAIREMAAIKNVFLADAGIPGLAADLAKNFDVAIAARLLQAAPDAMAATAALINRLIDVFAARVIIAHVWRMEGFEELDEVWLTRQAQAWMAQGMPANGIDTRFRWPEPVTMLRDYLAARGGGPVAVMVPAGSKSRVAGFVDPVRCRLGSDSEPSLAAFADAAASSSTKLSQPVPQLIRCPDLPSTARFRFPDGRCVKQRDDGVTVTTWWKDGCLHRDPRTGPASQLTDVEGRIIDEQFFEHGMPVEGPEPPAPDNRRARRAAKKAQRKNRRGQP